MRSFLLLLLFCGAAFGQSGVSNGSKPTHVAPNYDMSAGKIYIDTSYMLTTPNKGQSTYNVPIVCTGTAAACSPLSPVQTPNPGGAGSFRIGCVTSHQAFDDPIVWPGQPGKTHLHSFFGNDTTTSNSDLDLQATIGTSTCNGGIANRTGYWIPTPVYHCPNPVIAGCDGTRHGRPYLYYTNNVYYKNGAATFTAEMARMQWPPPKFRFIVGNATSTVIQGGTITGAGGWFACIDSVTGTRQFGLRMPTYEEVTASAWGCSDVELNIGFQQCWDGINLDSADHQSHVTPVYVNGYASAAYPAPYNTHVPDTGDGHCPNAAEYLAVTGLTAPTAGGFPVLFPAISVNAHWTITSTHDLDYIRLSSDLPETTGTVQAGTTTTQIKLDSNASSVNDYYSYGTIAIAGVPHLITAYVGATRTATVNTAFSVAPTAGTAYALRNAGGITAHADWVNGWDQTTVIASGRTVTDAILIKCLKNLGDCHNEDVGDVDTAHDVTSTPAAVNWYRMQNP